MSYRKLFVRSLAKSLRGHQSPTRENARTPSAYMLYDRKLRTGSETRADHLNDPSISETEAMLHQSLQRCRNIYGLIENSTRDFENEIKLIERIFNKYNDLAQKKGVRPEPKAKIAAKKSLLKKTSAEEMEKKANEDDENTEQAGEVTWDDLPQHTARCLVVDEEPLYKAFVSSMEKKRPPPPRFEDEKYPDPDAIDLFAPNETISTWKSPIDVSCMEPAPKTSRPSLSLGSRRLSTSTATQDTLSCIELTTPQANSTKVIANVIVDEKPMESKPQPAKKIPPPYKFITSEIHRDNAGMTKPKGDFSVSIPKRHSGLPSKVEQLFRSRYGKSKSPMEEEERSYDTPTVAYHKKTGLEAKLSCQQQQKAAITTSTHLLMSPDDCVPDKSPPKNNPCAKKDEGRCKKKEKPKCYNPCSNPEPCTIIGDTPKKCDEKKDGGGGCDTCEPLPQTCDKEEDKCKKKKDEKKEKGGGCGKKCAAGSSGGCGGGCKKDDCAKEPPKKKEEECCRDDWEYPEKPKDSPCDPPRKEPKRQERDKDRCGKNDKCDVKGGSTQTPPFDTIGLKTCQATCAKQEPDPCGDPCEQKPKELSRKKSGDSSIFGRICTGDKPGPGKPLTCRQKETCAKAAEDSARELTPQEAHIEKITKACRERMKLAAVTQKPVLQKSSSDITLKMKCTKPEEIAASAKPQKQKSACPGVSCKSSGFGDQGKPEPPLTPRKPGFPTPATPADEVPPPKPVCPKVPEKPRAIRSFQCKSTAPVYEGAAPEGCKKSKKVPCPQPPSTPTAEVCKPAPSDTRAPQTADDKCKKSYSTFSTPRIPPVGAEYEKVSKTDIISENTALMMRQHKVVRNHLRTYQSQTARALCDEKEDEGSPYPKPKESECGEENPECQERKSCELARPPCGRPKDKCWQPREK